MHVGTIGRDTEGEVAVIANVGGDAAEGRGALDADGEEGEGVGFEEGRGDGVGGGAGGVGDVDGAEGVGWWGERRGSVLVGVVWWVWIDEREGEVGEGGSGVGWGRRDELLRIRSGNNASQVVELGASALRWP